MNRLILWGPVCSETVAERLLLDLRVSYLALEDSERKEVFSALEELASASNEGDEDSTPIFGS